LNIEPENASRRLDRSAIQFEFTGYGERVDSVYNAGDRLYLDAGNALGPGVIDHHHLPAYVGSTAGLVLRHPELVRDSLRSGRNRHDRFTIIVHQYPDLDCLISAYLAICILADGELPRSAPALAKYADHIDTGHAGFNQEFPFALYAAYLLLMHDQGSLGPRGWRECLVRGLEVVEFVAAKLEDGNESIFEVDAFACDRVFKPRDRRELERDLTRYRNKLEDPGNACRPLQLQLPGEFGGTKTVDGLLARNVQDVDDPERCIYFKDWARSDRVNARLGDGFVALSVFISDRGDRGKNLPESRTAETQPATSMHRCILSVAPGSGVTLRGLGELLEQAESQARIEHRGADDRLIDPLTGARRPRPGYANADPWYDGRGHNYTIVDSPRDGTVLSADQIEEIFVEFGRLKQGQSPFADLPSPADEATDRSGLSDKSLDLHSLSRMSSLVDHWRKEQPPPTHVNQPLDVFISYSRTCAEWVENQIAKPLARARGGNMVFFDKHRLNAGMGWLTTLADAVMNCRLFLPIYCPAYFRSDFCQWELQLAMTRDPTGRKRIIAPVMLEPTELPAYCRLIQAQVDVDPTTCQRIVELADELLGKSQTGAT
jgi:hypothetical protein